MFTLIICACLIPKSTSSPQQFYVTPDESGYNPWNDYQNRYKPYEAPAPSHHQVQAPSTYYPAPAQQPAGVGSVQQQQLPPPYSYQQVNPNMLSLWGQQQPQPSQQSQPSLPSLPSLSSSPSLSSLPAFSSFPSLPSQSTHSLQPLIPNSLESLLLHPIFVIDSQVFAMYNLIKCWELQGDLKKCTELIEKIDALFNKGKKKDDKSDDKKKNKNKGKKNNNNKKKRKSTKKTNRDDDSRENEDDNDEDIDYEGGEDEDEDQED